MTGGAFDPFADLYDLFQDWERRLPREIPWLVGRLRARGVRSVLDAACGTGAHLDALRAEGFEVAGSDLAPEMVARARARLGPDAELQVAGFEEVGDRFPPRDAVIVVGNSLPNAGDEAAVDRSVRSLARAVRPGGVLVLHLLNFPRLVRGGGGPGPVKKVVRDGREHLFLKLFEVHPAEVALHVVALVEAEGAWSARHTRSSLCPIHPDRLAAMVEGAGLRILERTAGFSDQAFDPETSGDLVVLAVSG